MCSSTNFGVPLKFTSAFLLPKAFFKNSIIYHFHLEDEKRTIPPPYILFSISSISATNRSICLFTSLSDYETTHPIPCRQARPRGALIFFWMWFFGRAFPGRQRLKRFAVPDGGSQAARTVAALAEPLLASCKRFTSPFGGTCG